jgi:hypothetical protein
VEAKVTTPSNPTQLDKHNKKATKVKRIILDSVKDHLVPHIVEKKYIKDMYEALITLYHSVNIFRKMLMKNKLTSMHLSDIDTMASYLLKITELRDQLVAITMKVIDEELVPIARIVQGVYALEK